MAATGAWNSADLAGDASLLTAHADARGAIVQLVTTAAGASLTGTAAVAAASKSTATSAATIAGSAAVACIGQSTYQSATGTILGQAVIGAVSGLAVVAPTFTVVSPSAETTPGTDGGFPADFAAAAQTPIVVDVGLATLIIATVTRGERIEELAYKDGTWRGNFALASSESVPSAGVLRLRFLPAGGWDSDVVVSIDAYGNGASGSFSDTWFLPTVVETVVPETSVPEGAIDHVAEMFAQLPWYLASVDGDVPIPDPPAPPSPPPV